MYYMLYFKNSSEFPMPTDDKGRNQTRKFMENVLYYDVFQDAGEEVSEEVYYSVIEGSWLGFKAVLSYPANQRPSKNLLMSIQRRFTLFSQQGDDAPLMSNIGVKEISRADFLTATGVSHSKILSVKTEMLKSNPLIDRAPLRAAYSERES